MCALPTGALLACYQDGHYTDCFSLHVQGTFTHQQFVEAFYTTPLFKTERFVLRWLVGRPSTDDDVKRLAAGDTQAFAAWTVEDRAQDQLLLCDFRGKTRSWLMVEPVGGATRLYFGSAVIKAVSRDDGTPEMERSFSLLLGLHKLYSRALLRAAARRLRRKK